MKYLFALFLFISLECRAQCRSYWKNINGSDANTIIETDGNLLLGLYGKQEKQNLNFERLVEQIKVPRYDSYMLELVNARIDSLSKLSDSVSLRALKFAQVELADLFQILKDGTIEVALYDIDTFTFGDKQIAIYEFSTSLDTMWHEHFNNYHFFYTKEFEVVYTYYTERLTITFEPYTLDRNCKVEDSNLKLFTALKAFIKSRALHKE